MPKSDSYKTGAEMMIHLVHYGGWPVVVSALRQVEEVYEKKT